MVPINSVPKGFGPSQARGKHRFFENLVFLGLGAPQSRLHGIIRNRVGGLAWWGTKPHTIVVNWLPNWSTVAVTNVTVTRQVALQ